MPPSTEDILKPYIYNPSLIQKVSSRKTPNNISIVEPNPEWPSKYILLKTNINEALGCQITYIAHVGSTSVPDLPAKDVIDIDLTVHDASNEDIYVPALEAAGWQLFTREPDYYQHTLFICYDPPANLHVYSDGSAEIVRHRVFRDRLVRSREDRELYGQTKRDAAMEVAKIGGKMSDYSARKEDVVREILERAFSDEGYI